MQRQVNHAVITALLLTSCATRDLSRAYLAETEVRTLRAETEVKRLRESAVAGADESIKAHQPPFLTLHRVAMDIEGRSDAQADAGPAPLPGFVLSDPGTCKFISSMDNCLNNGESVDLVLSKSEVTRTAEMIATKLLPARNAQDERGDDGDGAGFVDRARVYMFAYYAEDDGFVSRDGKVLKAGDFDRTITNEEITPVVAIFFESIADELLTFSYESAGDANKASTRKTFPVIKGTDGKYIGGKRPTVSVYEEERRDNSIDLQLIDSHADGKPGITTLEYRGVVYVSRLVADNSELLSGLLLRALGDVQIAFVIGVHLAFGDNDTLAEIVDTMVYVTTLRTAEAAGLYAAWTLNVPSPDSGDLPSDSRAPARYEAALGAIGLSLPAQ